ncbi:MAG TPA: class I SAM-dependent methyltransferase, partial [Acidimicrobiales bacterium]|nr:class I SAM-dependent methyltransferase [Acidimicrobiales bacterium]
MNPGSRYGGERWAVRAHVGLRWWSCPFDAVLGQMPATGRILDYGCGHGVLTGELAARPGTEVVGVDVDPAKVEVAARTLGGTARVEVIGPGAVPAGPWDGIAVVDVLYLLDGAARADLLRRLAAELAPGGRIV